MQALSSVVLMKFDYVKVTQFNDKHQPIFHIRPWIRVGVFNPDYPSDVIYSLSLIDSGSDISFFTDEIGELLKFEIKKGHSALVNGIGGGTITIYIHQVGIVLENLKTLEQIKFIDFIGFSAKRFPPSMPQQTGILGTQGFFRNVDITLKYPKEIIVNANTSLN